MGVNSAGVAVAFDPEKLMVRENDRKRRDREVQREVAIYSGSGRGRCCSAFRLPLPAHLKA